jgi:uncharacterized protein YbcI
MGSEAVMASIEERSPAGRSLPMEISNLIVRLFSEYTGRGPNKARTIIRGNIVVCVTHGNMTKGERRLVQAGEGDLVVSVRRKFQTTMADDLIGGVELLTGRKVVSFLSDHNADTDHAAEVFVLEEDSPNGASDAD